MADVVQILPADRRLDTDVITSLLWDANERDITPIWRTNEALHLIMRSKYHNLHRWKRQTETTICGSISA